MVIMVDTKDYRVLKRAARAHVKTLSENHPQWLPLMIAIGRCPHRRIEKLVERGGVPYIKCLDCGTHRY